MNNPRRMSMVGNKSAKLRFIVVVLVKSARDRQLFKWRMLPACDLRECNNYGKLEAYPELEK